VGVGVNANDLGDLLAQDTIDRRARLPLRDQDRAIACMSISLSQCAKVPRIAFHFRITRQFVAIKRTFGAGRIVGMLADQAPAMTATKVNGLAVFHTSKGKLQVVQT
jgi:hypothetical protein